MGNQINANNILVHSSACYVYSKYEQLNITKSLCKTFSMIKCINFCTPNVQIYLLVHSVSIPFHFITPFPFVSARFNLSTCVCLWYSGVMFMCHLSPVAYNLC